jgi:DMSO/TMAO reductase YedYZ molybdopterin-dependent catalytic subunit
LPHDLRWREDAWGIAREDIIQLVDAIEPGWLTIVPHPPEFEAVGRQSTACFRERTFSMSLQRLPSNESSHERVPPGQTLTTKFPVLHVGHPPIFNPQTWTLKIAGEVEHALTLTWQEVLALPPITSVSDFHCVTTWSRLDNRWEGVAFQTIAERVQPTPQAQYVIGEDDWGYTANLALDVLMDDDVLLAYKHDGQDLDAEHGGPLRLVVPKRYGWKSVKWLRALYFRKQDEPGFWEVRGYSNTADPWIEDRYSG